MLSVTLQGLRGAQTYGINEDLSADLRNLLIMRPMVKHLKSTVGYGQIFYYNGMMTDISYQKYFKRAQRRAAAPMTEILNLFCSSFTRKPC